MVILQLFLVSQSCKCIRWNFLISDSLTVFSRDSRGESVLTECKSHADCTHPFDWCDLGSPILQILATMQQQLNRLEVKFDKILKSKKKGAGDLDVSKRSSSSFSRSPTPGPLSPTFPTQRTTSDNLFEGEIYSYFFSVLDSPALGCKRWSCVGRETLAPFLMWAMSKLERG